jgi:starch phosphorylase
MWTPEIRTRPATEFEVPEAFGRLRDIVYNLWWSWSPRAHLLYDRLAPAAWRHYRNPIDVLIDLGPEQWRAVEEDDDFARLYHKLVAEFEAYMNPAEPPWFDRTSGGYTGGPFAYFSTEYGWHECLQIYSGGLGVLSGDHCKSASDLGLPFVGVGLMYRHGYFRQTIDSEGLQQHYYPDFDVRRLPLRPVVDARDRDLHVPVELADRTVLLRVWKASIGRVPVLLLDADLPINHAADRAITSTLYVRGREMRLCQEILLGMGGAAVLEALGIEPAAWHLNEGHSALLGLRRIGRMLRDGASFDEALRRVASSAVFTTHTPVPAGHETFEVALVRRYLEGWARGQGLDIERLLALGRADGADGWFNLTVLALRTSDRANAVSRLHGEVSREMWRGLIEREGRPPFEVITNGVHPPSWVGPEIAELVRKHAGSGFDPVLPEAGLGEALESIADYELWTAHGQQKQRLLTVMRELALGQFARHGSSPDELRRVEELLDPEALTIGFARRFATYKRADLLLLNLERLSGILSSPERPVQLIFAGKAHPADRPGQELIRRICEAGRSPALAGRIVFVENYDMRIARHLVQGVDLWLNTPRRPLEASGTSGMKAAMNGVLNCSILDGWWCEGYDPSHGWKIGDGQNLGDEGAQDQADAEALYRVLSEEIVPAYYDRSENGLPTAWIQRMKRAMAELTPRFSSSRMAREYVERCYLNAARALDPR